jgi:hypothetical protein
MHQFLINFPDFSANLYRKNSYFTIQPAKEGLTLTIRSTKFISLEEVNKMLFEFIGLLAGQPSLDSYPVCEVINDIEAEVDFFKLKIERIFSNKESKKLAGKEIIIEGNFFKEDDDVANGVSTHKIKGRKPADFILKLIPAGPNNHLSKIHLYLNKV